jgi:CubicO group peptidase (beta-lactamase class C family)
VWLALNNPVGSQIILDQPETPILETSRFTVYIPAHSSMETDFTQLDHLLHATVPAVAPAMVCRVEQGGQVLFERGYGWINPMLKRQPVAPETLFDLGGLTKLFTTTACLRMWDAGLLQLDQPVARVLPSFSGARYVGDSEDPVTRLPSPPPAAWQDYPYPIDAGAVTFRQLLTHTAGLPAWRNLYRACGPAPDRPSTLHRAELLRRQMAGVEAILRADFAYPPGQSYADSDLGMILLGAALVRCTGDVTLADTMRNWVTGPLKLEAHFNPSCVMVDRIAPTEFCPWRQRRLHGEVHDENAAGMGGIAGHAGLFGTAADLCKLGNLYVTGGGRLLNPGIVAESISVHVETVAAGLPLAEAAPASALQAATALTLVGGIRRGLGWMLAGSRWPVAGGAELENASASGLSAISQQPAAGFGPHSFGYSGDTGGSLWCDPDRELVVALLTNRVYQGRNSGPITQLRPAIHAAVIDAVDGRS